MDFRNERLTYLVFFSCTILCVDYLNVPPIVTLDSSGHLYINPASLLLVFTCFTYDLKAWVTSYCLGKLDDEQEFYRIIL